LKVVGAMIDNPSATNAQIASMTKVSEPYIKKCKDDIQKLCPHLWKLLLHKNDVSFIISKLNANNGYEKSIIERLSRIYPEQWDGTMRLATSDDTMSNEILSIGLCSPKGDGRITNHWLMFLLYDFLFRIDSDDEINDRLARSIEPVGGYAGWRLKLRDGLFWNDGKSIGNEDIIHTVSNSPIAPMVQEIRKDDEKGVIFTLFRDDILFPRRLASLPILPSHSTIYEVTNGPFRLRKGKSPVSLHLYRNRDYYRDGHPKLDRINLKTFTRSYFAIKAVEDRKMDIFFPLSLHEIRQYSNASVQRFFWTSSDNPPIGDAS